MILRFFNNFGETFHKEEIKCCIKNHTCTKELLIEIVEKILNNISEFENADELLKLVAQHPNVNLKMLCKIVYFIFACRKFPKIIKIHN